MRESIELDLGVPQSFWSDLDARLASSADRFVQKLQTAGRAASTGGTGSPGANGPGGGFGGLVGGGGGGAPSLGGLAGAAASVASAGLDAAGAAYRNAPMGQLGTAAGFDKAVRGGIGGVLEATVGKVPVLGDAIMAEYSKMQSAIDDPEREAVGRLGGYYANLDSAGVRVDESTKRATFQRAISIARLRWQSMRESERLAGEANLSMRPSLFGLNQFGR